MLLRQNVQECCESSKVEDYIKGAVLDYSTFKMKQAKEGMWGKGFEQAGTYMLTCTQTSRICFPFYKGNSRVPICSEVLSGFSLFPSKCPLDVPAKDSHRPPFEADRT